MEQLKEGTEEFNKIKEEWREKAKKATIETLPEFLTELTEKYKHDYGTICHATAIAAEASAWAINDSDQGGITDFQAGAVMWEFVRSWNYSSNKTGLKIVDYDNFLYPQYCDDYNKTLTPDTWKAIKKEAKSNIIKADKAHDKYLVDLDQYYIDMAAFIEKYPDYQDNKDHYHHVGMATQKEHDAEKVKVESGFEFAPDKPYEGINKESNVYLHWVNITLGVVPFNYTVVE